MPLQRYQAHQLAGRTSIRQSYSEITDIQPLHLILRKLMNQQTILHLLKSANIVPIHKGGSKGLTKQNRPVDVTSHLTKVFEKDIRKYIVFHLEENKLLADHASAKS